MVSPFSSKHCTPCTKITRPLVGDIVEKYCQELGGQWRVVNEYYLEKEYLFKNFAEALQFTIQVGEIAEQEDHHPQIHLSYGKVRILLWTDTIHGLSENDFIIAAKIDTIVDPVSIDTFHLRESSRD